jgi:hypothetical protein
MWSQVSMKIMHNLLAHACAILAALSCLLLSCNYFDSAFSPIESTPTTLNGRVVDSLSKKGVPSATVTLTGLKDVTVQSDEYGLFQFPITTTGEKTLTVSAPGYHTVSRSVDLTIDAYEIDSIYLVRHNRRPRIDTVFYPNDTAGIPLTIRFSWTVSDADFGLDVSTEALKYFFYFDSINDPGILDSGTVFNAGSHGGSIPLNKPESFPPLQAGRLYYWKIVVKDLLGDSAVLGTDSFRTRPPFASSCPPEMALVELESRSFCMDKFEFTNEEYMLFDTNYILTYPNIMFSDTSNTPAIDRSYDSAKLACQNLGKRLCKISEWKAALGGYERLNYPYGNLYDSTKCHTHLDINKAMEGHTVPVGSLDSCVSPYGIYDLSGNVSEWMDCRGEVFCFDSIGTPLNYYVGGFWSSQTNSGITAIDFTLTSHRFDIGFRCCQDIQ